MRQPFVILSVQICITKDLYYERDDKILHRLRAPGQNDTFTAFVSYESCLQNRPPLLQ